MNRGPSKKKIIAVSSIVLGLITTIIMSAYKKNLGKLNIVKKLIRYKKLVTDGIKDFFEVQELNLRLEETTGKIKPIYEGIKIVWNSDESQQYTVIISPERISKSQALGHQSIEYLNEDEISNLQSQKYWMRKVDIDTDHYQVPFKSFQCRIVTSKQRVSRLLTYPQRRKALIHKNTIDAWITKRGLEYYITIIKPDRLKVVEYRILLYMDSGKGAMKTISEFENTITVNLGELPPCLCYVHAILAMGNPLEEFVCWIGEEDALKIDLHEYDLY